MTWFHEFCYPDFAQMLRYEELTYRHVSVHQTIEVYRTRRFGLIMVIDGAIQLTQADNHIYHEMLAHVPLLGHGCAFNVLIVGGGDGGTLREVLKHPVEYVRLVELDPAVVETSMRYFPEVGGDAFRDSRVEVIFQDAAAHVKSTDATFDVILIDSTDPCGPGGALFTADFYRECRRLLRRNGAIVIQGGTPLSMDEASRDAAAAFEAAFGAAEEYFAAVPSYPMGMIAYRGKALDGWKLSGDPATLERRFRKPNLDTHHYGPAVHRASFELFPMTSRRRCEEVALAAALTGALS